jgi:hypothetical protein
VERDEGQLSPRETPPPMNLQRVSAIGCNFTSQRAGRDARESRYLAERIGLQPMEKHRANRLSLTEITTRHLSATYGADPGVLSTIVGIHVPTIV